jgi:hypothetical protein
MGGKTPGQTSDLYKTVAALDRDIAERWRRQTNDDPNHKLTAADIEVIVGPLAKGRKTITEDQSKAIVELMQNPRASRPALARLTKYVDEIAAQLRFQAEPLVGDALKPILAALGHGTTGRIMFQSPKTNISYAPHDYAAMADLIGAGGRIFVYEIKNDRLYKIASNAAFVESGDDTIFLNRSTDPAERALRIVHEATHLIQDVRGGGLQRQYLEADAYVAESIATSAVNHGKQYFDGAIHDRAFAAAQLVLAGDSSAAGKAAFGKAYDNVVTAVAAEYTNPTKAYDKHGSKAETIALFKKYLEMEQFVEWAQDALETTFPLGEIARQLTP